MHLNTHLLLLLSAIYILRSTPSVFAFPWIRDGQTLEAAKLDKLSIKRSLEAMKRNPELMRQIRDLYTRQRAEATEWEQMHKRDIVGSSFNDTINVILGPENAVVTGIVDSLAASVEGSKLFPEANHPFKKPSKTDQRGPCPALNTMANHGYISRDGIVTAGEVFAASAELFNMGADLCAVLVSLSLALGGNLATLRFSIGGVDRRTNSLGKLGGLLGTETGLDGHGRVENDASATRCDFYKCNGDNHNMQPTLFRQMLDRALEQGGQFNVKAQAKHFHNRYEDSINTNPNFYFVPPGALATLGAYYFYPGFFSNGTIGVGGVANIASISSFAGARFKSDGSIVYVPERIPEQGWYRRAVPMFVSEALAGILSVYLDPRPVPFGGNAGSTNNFVPGPGLLPTSAQDVNGLGCFLYNALYANFFGEFQNILFTVEASVNAVLGLLGPAVSNFINCTPNYPDETDPNAYGGAKAYLQTANKLPGAPRKNACLLGSNSECMSNTNTYDDDNAVPNRWRYTSVAATEGNPKP